MEGFIRYMQATAGMSTTSAYHYSLAVGDFVRWFEGSYGHKPSKLFRQNVEEYKAYLLNVKSQSAKTINFKLGALKKWNEYLVDQDGQKEIVIDKQMLIRIQREYASPAMFGVEAVNRLRQASLEYGSKRDYALVNLLAFTGLRISEALNLKLGDVHFESRELVVRQGKMNKSRTVLLAEKVIVPLRDYLNSERNLYKTANESSYVFVSRLRSQLDRMTVNKLFRKYNKLAGLEGVTPHGLRHFCCSYLLENGFNVHEVAYMAGHSNIHTTLLYTNPSRKAMLDKLNKF